MTVKGESVMKTTDAVAQGKLYVVVPPAFKNANGRVVMAPANSTAAGLLSSPGARSRHDRHALQYHGARHRRVRGCSGHRQGHLRGVAMADGKQIEWLQSENARLRQELAARDGGSMIREVRPRSAFDATDVEARTLVAKVQGAYPMLAWQLPSGASAEELQRNYMRQFRAAMIGLSAMGRAEGVDYGHALSFWIETEEASNKLRDIATSIHPRVFLCAVVASGDIAFTRWWQSGDELALALRVGGDGGASRAWRRVLSGEMDVLKPVAARPLKEQQRSQVRVFGDPIW
jgi:hypothetical protein